MSRLLIARRLLQPYIVWGVVIEQGDAYLGASDLDWHMDWVATGDPKATRSVLGEHIHTTNM